MITVRSIERHERDAVLDLLHEWFGDREFFRRYFEYDPAFRDDLCLVAVDGGRIVSTLQIFPKTVAVDGVPLLVGGIGNVFTGAEYRSRGVASMLLRRAVEIMEAEGFDLSLLFASRLTFYSQFGWASHRRLLGAATPPPSVPAPVHRVRRFEPSVDLEAVMAIYDEYNRGRNGAVIRDRRYWEGQLRYAGNPDETFLVAEGEGQVLAYGRLMMLYGIETVMEHGVARGAREALMDVLLALAERARSAGFVVLQLGADPALRDELGAKRFAVQDVEDVFWMWRIIAPDRVAAKLRLAPEQVGSADFLDQILPYTGSVYWISDRF